MFGLTTNCLDWIARETFNRRKVQVKNDLYQLTIPFNRKVDSTIPSISWHTSIKPSGICQSSSVLSWIHSHAVIWSCLWFAWILCIMEKVKEESQKEWFNQLKTTRFIGQSVGGYGSSWEVSGRSVRGHWIGIGDFCGIFGRSISRGYVGIPGKFTGNTWGRPFYPFFFSP